MARNLSHNLKRFVAGVCALLLMAGSIPANTDFGGLFGGSSIVASADYVDGSLVVGNTSVTSTITNGDGWSFDADNNTLTLNGANITQCEETGCGIYYGGSSPLSIVLVGDNTIDISSTNGDVGICAGNSLFNISGTGKLTVKGKSEGIYAYYGVNFNGGTVDVEATYYAVNIGEGNIIIGNATVTATATDTSMAHALVGNVINSIAGKGWSNAAGTEDETAIAVSETGRDLMFYKKVQFTASAASPYTDFIPTANDSDDVLTGKQVTFGGKKWHIIKDESTSATSGTVTLLMANSFGNTKFDENGSNVYDNSSIKTALGNLTTDGSFKEFADVIKDTDFGKIYLLSDTEAAEVPQNLRKAFDGDAWWLRTQGTNAGNVKYVYVNDTSQHNPGRIVDAGVIANTSIVGVRPALQVDLSKVVFDATSKTFNLPATAPTVNSVTGTTLVKGYTTGGVSISATAPTGHTLSYQWYSNTTDSNEGGTKIEGATSAKYNIETGKDPGTYYYYCVVTATRTDNSLTASISSSAAAVTVADDTDKLIAKLAQNNSIDLNDYDLVPAEDMYYNLGQYWNSGNPSGRSVDAESNNCVATKQFTLDKLPKNSIIFCKPYYAFESVAWNTETGKKITTGKKNAQLIKIEDLFDWWDVYSAYGFNLTKYVEGGFDTQTEMTSADLEHMSDIFRIYVPKSEAVAKVGNNSYSTLAEAVRAAQQGDTIVMQRDATDNLVLTEGKMITFDLNGFKLTNDGRHSTIITQKGSTLVIADSSEEKTGRVDNIRHSYAPLCNNGGTVVLDGGTFTRSQEAGNGINSYYTVVNRGLMLINEGATIDNATCSDSSLIDNGFNELNRTGYRELDPNISYGYAEAESSENPTLIINGGTFIGGRHTLKNDVNGVATIKGGSFSSSTGNAVYNVGELTISGGEFTANAEGKFALHSAAESGKTYGPESAAGNTTVTGGTFFGKLQKDDDASMAISGGEFSEVVPENYCAEWYVPVTTKNDHEMYTVSLASATVITPPTAKENLKYNGTEQTLVNEGTVTGGTLEYGFAEPAEVIGKGGQYVLSGDDLTVGKIFKPSDFDGFIFPTGKSVKLLNNNDVFSPYNGSDQSLYDHVNVFLNGITPTICSDDNTYTEFPNGCDALRIDKINGDTIEITAVKSSECFEVKTWSATPPKGIDAGEYNVYYRVKGDDNHNDIAPTKIENVKIAKADPTVTTAPQAKTLTYNGELQELITAGTSEDGTVQYAVVETDGDTPEYTVVKLDSYTSLYPSDAEVNTVYTPDLEGENKGNAGVSFSGGAYIIDDITYTGIRLRYNPGNSKYYLTTNKGTLNLAEGIDGLLITDIDSDSGNVYIELVNTANPAGEVEIDEEAWVESIPKETDAGEYNVYYRVKGDANHNDSKPTKIDGVKIAEAEITGVTLTPRAPKAILKSGKTRVNVGFSAEVEGAEIEEYGLLYGNTGTKDVSEFTIENVNGESICKLENNYGANVLDKGNGVVARGYVKVNGVYIYTDNLGGSYAELTAQV